MPKRRQNALDAVDDIVENAVATLFERGADFVEKLRTQQVERAAAGPAVRTHYTCASCQKSFAVADMQMIDPSASYGVCRPCFAFVWQAATDKVKYLAKKAQEAAAARARARAAASQGPAASPPPPPKRPPWEVLGVTPDASVDEIGKAWRRLAAQYHPDRVSGDPTVTAEDRERMRAMFDEITRCRDAMLKVRKAPS